MKCASPVLVRDKVHMTASGRVQFSSGGTTYAPCGRCLPCRMTKARMWSLRILHESKYHDFSVFVTLTYDDEHLKSPSLVKEDAQKFLKRLRKNISPRKIRFYLSGEYGDIGKRPHYHAILFGLSKADTPIIDRSWSKGFVHVGEVTEESARYVASYTMKKLSGSRAAEYQLRGVIPEFAHMSQGIGRNYADENAEFLNRHQFCTIKGSKVGVPRYYAKRCFSEDAKQKRSEKMVQFSRESLERAKIKGGVNQDFQAADYQRTERMQLLADAEVRQKLSRRKL